MTVTFNPDGAARPLLAELAEVALIDARSCAAVGGMSRTWWYDEVRKGHAPAPVIRQSRCSRWLLSAVREYWAARARQADHEAGTQVLARAKKASTESAKKKRCAGDNGKER